MSRRLLPAQGQRCSILPCASEMSANHRIKKYVPLTTPVKMARAIGNPLSSAPMVSKKLCCRRCKKESRCWLSSSFGGLPQRKCRRSSSALPKHHHCQRPSPRHSSPTTPQNKIENKIVRGHFKCTSLKSVACKYSPSANTVNQMVYDSTPQFGPINVHLTATYT